MNVTQVYYVLSVARYRSFSKAAGQIFISQSALSQQIQRLEAELGYDLFRRTPQGVVLTPEGESFCLHGQSAVSSWEEFCRQVAPQGSSLHRQLRIGMGTRVYSNGLFEDVVRFFEDHPEVEVTFVAEAGQDFIAGLQSGTLDLALDRLPQEIPAGQSVLASYELIRERQCILMSPDDPRRTLPGISFSDLAGCAMASGLENSIEDRTLKEIRQRYGISFRRVYRSDSMDTVMQLVRSGKVLALGPQSSAGYYGVAAVPLVPAMEVSLKFICLKKNAKRPDIALFRRYMQDICKKARQCGSFQ